MLNYHRGEVNDPADETDNNDNMINNKTTTSKSFKYNTKITGKTPINTTRLNAEVVVPLIYFSNVWRSLNLPLNNCKKELDLSWSKECIITEVSRTFKTVDPNGDPFVYELVTNNWSNISNK